MSASGSPEDKVVGFTGKRVVIVASSWHDQIMNALIEGATRVVTAAGVSAEVHRVPGTFELPIAARAAAFAGADAVVALGVVIRGETPHFDYVCQAATDGILQVSLETGVPVGFGVLTCDDEKQALDRSGLPGSKEDKGAQAAAAALNTWVTLKQISS